MTNPFESLSWDADELERARRLLDAARAHDTGKPRKLHLQPVPYETPMSPSANIIKGILSVAHRLGEIGLDETKEDDRALLEFAETMVTMESDSLAPLESPVQIASAKVKRAGNKVGHLAMAFVIGVKP